MAENAQDVSFWSSMAAIFRLDKAVVILSVVSISVPRAERSVARKFEKQFFWRSAIELRPEDRAGRIRTCDFPLKRRMYASLVRARTGVPHERVSKNLCPRASSRSNLHNALNAPIAHWWAIRFSSRSLCVRMYASAIRARGHHASLAVDGFRSDDQVAALRAVHDVSAQALLADVQVAG